MKFAKLSLVAALALSATSAFAIENVKVDGQAVFYYQTQAEDGTGEDLLSKNNSNANVGLTVRATADLGNGFSAGVRGYYLDTLGLEGNIVNNVMQVGDAGDPVGGAGWLGEGYVTYAFGNTMVKAGRQELKTPFAFTEVWSVFPTTFDATLIVNKDIQDITLVGAFVSEANTNSNMGDFMKVGQTVGLTANASAANQWGNGAYMLAATYTGVADTTINAYAYNLRSFANAYWVDAKTKFGGTDVFDGITAKIAYANVDPDAGKTTDAITAEVSTKVANFNLSAAYSDVSAGTHGIYNIAGAGIKTSLYTATIFADADEAGATDTKSWKIKASTDVVGVKVIGQYARFDHGNSAGGVGIKGGATLQNNTSDSFELILKKRVAEIDLMAIYFYTDDVASRNTGAIRTGEEDGLRFVARYNF